MSDMLGISSGAIGAYQRALTTVSNNIANVNTEGYSRQDVVLTDSAPKKMASMYVGTGVMLQTIKRQFDAFAESNLRNSASDLASQKPMVDYTKRVMDVMGDKSIGLSSAFDEYFSAAGALSADPASSVLRTSFLRSADGVASRFGELTTQLNLVATETRQGIQSVTDQVNTLTSQLALINQGLTKSPTLEGQPAELLDRRDLTLRKLSELTRIKTTYTANGIVNVSMGTTMTEGLVVNGIKARPIGIDSQVKDKVELVLDPYDKTEALASASGGMLGGYQSFISQVLEPSQKGLNALAQTFASEANTIQKNGIDGYGQMGQALFSFDPNASSPSAGIRIALNDGMRIATASQFRVSEGNSNVTTTRASVKFSGSTPTTALSNTHLVNNPNKTAGVTFKVDGASEYTPVTTLSAGVKAAFYMDQAAPGQQLQVLTRDGRQLLGATLSETEKFQLFKPENGFTPNATYSDAYLNQSGSAAYRGIDMFYGAKATVTYGQNLDAMGKAGNPLPLSAALETGRINANDFSIAAGALKLNGVNLPELALQTQTQIVIAGVVPPVNGPTMFNLNAVVNGTPINPVYRFSPTDTLESLRASIEQDLSPAKVELINQGKDIRITGNADVSTFSFAPANFAEFDSGLTFGTPSGNPDFKNFSVTVGDLKLQVNDLKATNLSDLALELNDGLAQLPQGSGLKVGILNSALIVEDRNGRQIKDVSLALSDSASAGASVGSVTINNANAINPKVELNSPAMQIANWFNGQSQATISAPSFGSRGFDALKATIGGVPFDVDLSQFAMGPLDQLAKTLQEQLRLQDGGADITVSIENKDQLKITDAAGREFKDFALVPKPVSDATQTPAISGEVTLDNSVVSRSHVRAEVFSEVRVSVAQLQFDKPLILNGQVITGYNTVDSLVKQINKSDAGLVASIGSDGQLLISNPQGGAIRIADTSQGNALNIKPDTYNGQVRMVQVARDMRVGSAEIDVKKPLTINGVNLSEASFPLPALVNSGQYAVSYGYPSKWVSASSSEDLVNALNSSATISGISLPKADQTLSLSLKVGGQPLEIKGLTANTLNSLATEVASRLADAGYPDVSVSSQTGGLIFSNTAGLDVTPVSLKAVVTGSEPVVAMVAGNIDAKFGDNYYATLQDGKLSIGAIKGNLSETDLKNSFMVKANNADVVATPSVKNLDELIARINSKFQQTGVVASKDINGDLKLSTTDAKGTRDISIGPALDAEGNFAPNALNLKPADYGVAYRLQEMLQDPSQLHDVRLSFGSYVDIQPGVPPTTKFGDPADLANIGLRTGAYIEGGCPDDLLLFVTGKGATDIAVGFSGQPDNTRDSLRSQTLLVKFTAADRYSIIDSKTGTELADRHYDPNTLEPVVAFNGLQLKLTHAPSVGDSYTIDGNQDGLGSNTNMLDMVDLNKKPTANGKTLANTYIDQINNVGNLAQQANITQQAMTVVNDQAIAARDKVSGVNLDEEAAALIRYQQAYQACAKALQVSGQLFDTIAQIR